jgi:hypothetical protein
VLIPANALQESQAFKVPHLRNLYEKTGFTDAAGPQKRGFGFIHDGSTDNIFNFLLSPVFQFANNQQRTDVEAFMLSFDTGTAPTVGVQQTVDAQNRNDAAVVARIALLVARADLGDIDLVVKGRLNGEARGWLYQAGLFAGDRVSEAALSEGDLRSLATGNGGEFTYTGVPPGNGLRIGLDRDGDTWRDRDELDAGTNPADPNSFPGSAAVHDPGPAGGAMTAALERPAQNPVPAAGTSISFTVSEPADVQWPCSTRRVGSSASSCRAAASRAPFRCPGMDARTMARRCRRASTSTDWRPPAPAGRSCSRNAWCWSADLERRDLKRPRPRRARV